MEQGHSFSNTVIARAVTVSFLEASEGRHEMKGK
jgi:hypothetical protein